MLTKAEDLSTTPQQCLLTDKAITASCRPPPQPRASTHPLPPGDARGPIFHDKRVHPSSSREQGPGVIPSSCPAVRGQQKAPTCSYSRPQPRPDPGATPPTPGSQSPTWELQLSHAPSPVATPPTPRSQALTWQPHLLFREPRPYSWSHASYSGVRSTAPGPASLPLWPGFDIPVMIWWGLSMHWEPCRAQV